MGLRGPVTSEQNVDLTRIRRSQQYLTGLIEQILVFTQLDAHQVAIDLQDVPVDDLMRDAETMVEPQIRARGIDYSYIASHPGLVIRADREKTQQIVLNLLTNAAKYTNPGGRLTTSCETRNGSVHVCVTDTGAGIPDSMLSHIFEPFVQLDRRLNQPREGVGLGLTISRDLARAMGGDLFVESTVGVGSTFTLVLPRTETRARIPDTGEDSYSGDFATLATLPFSVDLIARPVAWRLHLRIGQMQATEELDRELEGSPLWNHDLAPTPPSRRTWSTYNIAAFGSAWPSSSRRTRWRRA